MLGWVVFRCCWESQVKQDCVLVWGYLFNAVGHCYCDWLFKHGVMYNCACGVPCCCVSVFKQGLEFLFQCCCVEYCCALVI